MAEIRKQARERRAESNAAILALMKQVAGHCGHPGHYTTKEVIAIVKAQEGQQERKLADMDDFCDGCPNEGECLARGVCLDCERWKLVQRLIAEAWYVLSGGDDPAERCQGCGCAGYGNLRDLLKETAAVIPKEYHPMI